jgi:hypothetical protein
MTGAGTGASRSVILVVTAGVPLRLSSIGMTTEDTRIVLRAGNDRLIVDHPGQPADYVRTDGTVWTWRERWHLVGGVRDGERIVGRLRLRAYDLVTPGTNSAGAAKVQQ